ncbi:MAG: hypothetical protein LBU34_04190 [Planctomycetaceae bacterium]|jgi:hypothetical protein|nr:hypothetical protein [Planctomycetaceae bacterium]
MTQNMVFLIIGNKFVANRGKFTANEGATEPFGGAIASRVQANAPRRGTTAPHGGANASCVLANVAYLLISYLKTKTTENWTITRQAMF